MGRLRNCFGTENNWTEESLQKMTEWCDRKCSYYIIGKEIGESGTPHLQFYLEFKGQVEWDHIKKNFPRWHFEPRDKKSTAENSSAYCAKGAQSKSEWNKFKTEGENYGRDVDILQKGAISLPQGKRTDLNSVRESVQHGLGIRDMITTGEISSLQQFTLAEKLLKYYEKPRAFKPTVTWLWGGPGVGKTRYAYDHGKQYGEIYKLMKGAKWFEGYDKQEVLLIDDVRCSTFEFEDLLALLDRYEYRIEHKGGSRQLLARHIYITCPVEPTELFKAWKWCEDLTQLTRRIDNLIEVKEGEEYHSEDSEVG